MEAATIETAWVVEPPLLEHLLDQEISAFISEGVSAISHTRAERWGGGARNGVKHAGRKYCDDLFGEGERVPNKTNLLVHI